MESKRFSVTINAPREKVWKVLWNDETYRKWTSAFSEGSYAVSDWKEGSKIQFLSPEGSGMYSTIDKKKENEFISFKHIGEIKGGKEQPLNEETKKWSGAFENYTLTENNGKTTLTVDIDVAGEFGDFFEKTFPAALQKVKDLSEA
jgi:uncharacterized protein YndB with AHSA1/START domain